MTKLSTEHRVRPLRVRGGNQKMRALRLDVGNFSWGSEAFAKKARILDVVYHPSNNELVRTKTLTKAAIVQVDATPFRQWYEQQYGIILGKKKAAKGKEAKEGAPEIKHSNHVLRKQKKRDETRIIDPHVEEQFAAGRLYAAVTSRPGQVGRADGQILEGPELQFYMKKMLKKKAK